MRPLPKELQELFPCPPGHLPARPWWAKSGERADGVLCRRHDDLWDGTSQLGWVEMMTKTVVYVDRRQPIGHPGLRPGQVWCTVLDVGRDCPMTVSYTVLGKSWKGEVVALSSAHHPSIALGGGVSEGPFPEVMLFPKGNPELFLMADPGCPHLAPWSSAEEKEV